MTTNFKKKALSLLSLLLLFVPAVVMTSCGDDNDEPDPGQKPTQQATLTEYTATYSLTLSQPYYDFFDVEVEYNFGNGETKKETVTKDMVFTTTLTKVPESEFIFKVNATPKANQPAVEEGEKYTLQHSITHIAIGTFSDNHQETIAGGSSLVSGTLTLGGEGMEKYIGQAHQICNFSQEYKYASK